MRLEVFMRFGRTILASLAPLIGLSALMTMIAASQTASSENRASHSAHRLVLLLQTAVHLGTPAAETPSIRLVSDHPSPQAVLPLTAMAASPYRHSLWLLSSPVAVDILARRPHQTLLRC
jgi:hypothetical protein